MASVSSERPIAARCRVPKLRSVTGNCVSGRMQRAAMISSPRMITAPSCKGPYRVKIASTNSAFTGAFTGEPRRAYSSRPTSRSTAMIAPIRLRARISAACANTCTVSDVCSGREKRRQNRL